MSTAAPNDAARLDAEHLLGTFERHCHAAAKAARLFRKHHAKGCRCAWCADRTPSDVAGIREDLAGAAWQLGQLAACTESDHGGRVSTAADTPAVVAEDKKVGPMLATLFRLADALGEVLDLIERAEELTDKHVSLADELRAVGASQDRGGILSRSDVAHLLNDLRGVAYVVRVGRDTVEGNLPGWVRPRP